MKKKKTGRLILIIISVLAIAAAVLFSGILVIPTAGSLAGYTTVKSYNILAAQHQRELDILADYSKGSFTLQNPYVIQDPYQANPLSALVLFNTPETSRITVKVNGKNFFSTFTYTYPEFSQNHQIAVLGLYPGIRNQVILTAENQNGTVVTKQLELMTEALPNDFPDITVLDANPEQMQVGVNLMISCFDYNYTYLLDANGDVRGYFSNKNFGHGTAMRILKNGRLLATGDVMKLMPYNMYNLWEMNLLGKVFVEYHIPNGVHHDIIELENGDFLAASNNKNMPMAYDTREDVVIRIDRNTGLVKNEYDLRQILPDFRQPYHHFDPEVLNALNRDWAHLNSIEVDQRDNSIIASSPIQSVVVKFNAETKQIAWILAPHEGWDGELSLYQPFLLKPVGQPFEWSWGQHSVKILPDSDSDPNTLDLILFDNGQSRSFIEAGSVPAAQNFSRAVIYRINEKEKTVQQLWQFGKELGTQGYATFLGNADQLVDTGNVLISFGGMLRKDGVPVDTIVMGVLGKQIVQSRVVEVRQDGQVVFDASITPRNSSSSETYQVRKINLYTTGIEYRLGESQGISIGEIQAAAQTTYDLPGFFLPHLGFDFSQLRKDDGYLILEGNFLYDKQSYLLGKVVFILKSQQHQYIYASNSGLNGNFMSRIDLRSLPPGEYAIYAAGGVVDGNDAVGKIKPGYNPTGYKVVVP